MKHKTNNKVLKIVAVLLLVIVAFPTFSSVFGAINEDYDGSTPTYGSSLNFLEGAGNILARPVFWLVNTIASIAEYLLTQFAYLLQSATGSDSDALMPWADAVIYNGVPALDINFINPSQGSFSSIIGKVISNMYYTIFSITITFFGIAVLIMAIKMATTAIAAEKARYKESVVNFVISLILIFSIHYFISFVFYLNESIVKVAFNISELQLEGTLEKMAELNNVTAEELVNNISEVSNSRNWFSGDDTWSKYKAVETYIHDSIWDEGKNEMILGYLVSDLGDYFTKYDGNDAQNPDDLTKSIVLWTMVDCIKNEGEDGVIFSESQLSGYNTDGMTVDWKDKNPLYLKLKESYDSNFEHSGDDYEIHSHYQEFQEIYEDNFAIPSGGSYGAQEKTVMNAMNLAAQKYKANTDSTINSDDEESNNVTNFSQLGNSVVSQLANYFKMQRYDVGGEINLIGALLYAIFVIQSVMYFFAYLKRFFYIIILAFFAPILVLFDFLSSSMGKKGDTLSKWIKEFCALVFVQSIQAFLLTMIASLIVNINVTVMEDITETGAQGLAIINIIALASMAKLEDLISNMVGLKSSIADVGLSGGAKMGLHGLAGGMMTLAAAKRIGDNGKKIFGGARNWAAGNKEVKSALASKKRKLDQFAEISNASGAAGAGAGGDTGGGAGSGSGAGGSGSAGGGTSSLTIKDKHKYQDALEACDAKIAEAKRKRNQAIVGTIGGGFESVGALAGGLTGAALAGTIHAAAGDFNLSDVASDAIKGAGVGDAIVAGTMNAVAGTVGWAGDTASSNVAIRRKIDKEIQDKQKLVTDAYRRAGFDVSDL